MTGTGDTFSNRLCVKKICNLRKPGGNADLSPSSFICSDKGSQHIKRYLQSCYSQYSYQLQLIKPSVSLIHCFAVLFDCLFFKPVSKLFIITNFSKLEDSQFKINPKGLTTQTKAFKNAITEQNSRYYSWACSSAVSMLKSMKVRHLGHDQQRK